MRADLTDGQNNQLITSSETAAVRRYYGPTGLGVSAARIQLLRHTGSGSAPPALQPCDSAAPPATNKRSEIAAPGQARPLPISPLWCPIEASLHPRWREINAATITWMTQMGLAHDLNQHRRLSSISPGELAAYTIEPTADGPGSQFASDLLMWLFAFDDTYCDEGSDGVHPDRMALFVADVVRLAETGAARDFDNPAMRALGELRGRLNELATPVQISRWAHAMRSYLTYQVWEAAHRAHGTIPVVDAYLVARIANGSMPACVMAQDFCSSFDVPAAEMESVPVKALSEMCCLIVGLDNDLMSHWKETLRSSDGINLIDVLAAEHQCSPEQALTLAATIRDCILTRFLELRQQATGTLSDEGRRYLQLLGAWIRGNINWSMTSKRYLNPENPADLPSVITPTRTTPIVGPLPYPSIAWWWTCTTAVKLPPTKRSASWEGRKRGTRAAAVAPLISM